MCELFFNFLLYKTVNKYYTLLSNQHAVSFEKNTKLLRLEFSAKNNDRPAHREDTNSSTQPRMAIHNSNSY